MFEKNTEQLTQTLPDQGQQTAPNPRRQAEIREFLAVFPEAAARELPQAVWDLVRRGFSLTGAYVLYLRAQAPAPGQAPASTGSLRSASGSGPIRDPFLQGWEED